MIRVPAPGRFEIRVVDGAANPYLAFAGVLAAGLDGIEQHIDPGTANHDNLYQMPEEELATRGIDILPASLAEALDALAKDAVVQEGLGTAYAKYYLKVKTEEWTLHNRTVTPWERDYYLGTY
jgi:glutamine synthetase